MFAVELFQHRLYFSIILQLTPLRQNEVVPFKVKDLFHFTRICIVVETECYNVKYLTLSLVNDSHRNIDKVTTYCDLHTDPVKNYSLRVNIKLFVDSNIDICLFSYPKRWYIFLG